MMYNHQGRAGVRYHFKVACSKFRRAHSRRESQGVCLALQISPGRGEAGATLQGAKEHKGRFKEELTRIDGVFYLRAPFLYLLCCVQQLMRDFHLAASKCSRMFLMVWWVKLNFFDLHRPHRTYCLSWMRSWLLVSKALNTEGVQDKESRGKCWCSCFCVFLNEACRI